MSNETGAPGIVGSMAGLGGCCRKPAIVDWSKDRDHGLSTDGLVNARCGARWYGRGADVRVFTRRQWDVWVEEGDALDEGVDCGTAELASPPHYTHTRRCDNCDWCHETTELLALCARPETMANGWNLRSSTCEEHVLKTPNVRGNRAEAGAQEHANE